MKTLRSIVSLIFVALMLVSCVTAAFAEETATSYSVVTVKPSEAGDGKYYVDTEGKTDVLAYIPGYYNAPKYGADYQDETNIPRITDGVYAIEPLKDLYGISYCNLAWCNSGEQTDLTAAGGTFEYKLTTGETAKYLYTWEWKELDVDVNSFSMWFNNETAYYDYETNSAHSWWQVDSQWAILVSQDGGKTYTVAYESVPYTEVTEGETTTVTGCAAWLKSEGGEWEMYDAVDSDKAFLFRYRKCSGEFVTEFKKVTNIVYACIQPRRNGNSYKPFYYGNRLVELDVYGTINSTKYDQTTAAPETTVEPETTVAPETKAPETKAPETEAPVVTTTAPETEAPVVETEAPATEAPETDAPATKSGCGSSVACGAMVLVAVLGSALLKKKD